MRPGVGWIGLKLFLVGIGGDRWGDYIRYVKGRCERGYCYWEIG